MVATVFEVFTMTQALPLARLLHNSLRWALVSPFARGDLLVFKELKHCVQGNWIRIPACLTPSSNLTSCINQHVAASQGQRTSVHGWLWSVPGGGTQD